MSQLLGGRYQFIKVLGSDLQGQTYLVGDTQLEGYPKCVIKRLRLPSQNPRTLKFVLILLQKKAESLKRLGKHEHFPQILTYFEEGNSFYLVEEFIPGRPLSEEMQPGQPLLEAQVVQLLRQILEILVVMHGRGLIHRCIKPSNLIRRADGSLVLTGFGIFKEISTQAMRSSAATETSPDAASQNGNGATAYTSAEQLQGQPQFSSDLYAVGMIAIQALTGLSPTELKKLQHASNSGNPNRFWYNRISVSPALVNILDRMVHPDSKQRYQLATEILDDLHSAKMDETVSPTPSVSKPQESRPLTAKQQSLPTTRLLLPGLGIVAIALLALVALWYSHLPQTLLASFFLRQAAGQAEQGQQQQAIANYTQAIQLDPSSTAYYNRGLVYEQQGEPQAALEDLTQAIQIDPHQAQAYYYRGNIRYELGDRQNAVADYTQAIAIDPKSTNAYVNRGNVRAELNDDQGAIADYTQAIQIDPSLAPAYLNRCLSRSNIDEHREAIADCTQAINLQPNSVLAYQNRGLARRRLGDSAGAIEDFNIAIRLDPDDADPYYNRGLARSEMGDRQGAIADYSEAIRRDPQHVFAYYDRGLERAEAGDRVGAIADLQQSAQLCLDAGKTSCYEDAQYQLRQLQP